MVDPSQVTTSQPLAACSIVLLENTVLVPGPGKKPNQTKNKVPLPQPPVTGWVFSILLHSQAILADTAELPDAATAHVHIQRRAGASSHVLKQSCQTRHQMSTQLLLLPPNPSALSYLTLATTDSQRFFSLPSRWGEKNPVPY